MVSQGGVQVEVTEELYGGSEQPEWVLRARWQMKDGPEQTLVFGHNRYGGELVWLEAKIRDMLRSAYEQGRADAALGF
jgi:hypothetical protein